MQHERGFSLIELMITVTVLTILTFGVLPLVKVTVRRQKEQQLRESLRQIRSAIDEFHRDTIGMVCTGTPIGGGGTGGSGGGGGGGFIPQPGNIPIDPRSQVVISDCTLFGVDNPDRYPPDLETLVNGVNVMPRLGPLQDRNNPDKPPTELGKLSAKQKVYLRALPIDPMTGKADWDLRSNYDAADSTSWGGENVFDVRSHSKATALNGEKYSDW